MPVLPRFELPHIEREPDAPPVTRIRRMGRWALVIGVVGFTALLWFAAFNRWGTNDVPGALDNSRAFIEAADQRCASSVEAIDAARPASSATSPQDRAVIIDNANAELNEMLLDIRTIGAGSPADQVVVDQWLDDWNAFLGFRRVHADKLRAGNDVRFTVERADERSLDARIDAFASVNQIFSCATPGDV